MQFQQTNPQTDNKVPSQITMFLQQNQPQQAAAAQSHLAASANGQFIQGQQQSVLINPTTYHLQHSVPKPFNIPQQKTTIPSQNYFNTGSLNNTLYPTPSSNISHIKQEVDDNFTNMQTDIDFNLNDPLSNMMSPHPGSPLEISPEFDGLDELTNNQRNSNSMANSPYGTSPLVISQPVNIVGSNHYHNIGEETVFENIPQINSFTGSATAINVKGGIPSHLTAPGINNGLYSMSMPVNGTNGNNFFNQPSSFGSYAGGDLALKSGSFDFLEELNDNSKQLEILNEKRRRRRESHNAVERRRRDNINEKIHELSTLIPEHILNPNNGEGPVGKPNKGIILRKSVEYIKHLQALVEKQEAKNKELEEELEKLKQK